MEPMAARPFVGREDPEMVARYAVFFCTSAVTVTGLISQSK